MGPDLGGLSPSSERGHRSGGAGHLADAAPPPHLSLSSSAPSRGGGSTIIPTSRRGERGPQRSWLQGQPGARWGARHTISKGSGSLFLAYLPCAGVPGSPVSGLHSPSWQHHDIDSTSCVETRTIWCCREVPGPEELSAGPAAPEPQGRKATPDPALPPPQRKATGTRHTSTARAGALLPPTAQHEVMMKPAQQWKPQKHFLSAGPGGLEPHSRPRPPQEAGGVLR